MSVENMPDERLIGFYDNIRQLADADRAQNCNLTASPELREYAETLRFELAKRRLNPRPITWPD